MKTTRVTLLAAESLLVVGLLYKFADACLLARDGVIPVSDAVVRCALYAAAMFVIERLGRGLVPGQTQEHLAEYLVVPPAIASVLLSISLRPPMKGQSGLWLPLEWHKLPNNFVLMARVSPLETIVLVLTILLFLALIVRGANGRFAFLAFAAALAVFIAVVKMPAERRLPQFAASFVSPFILAAAFALFRRPRWASRSLIGAALGLLIFLHYGAYWPIVPHRLSPLAGAPGVTLLFPRAHHPPPFPLTAMRDLIVDPATDTAFTSYGPASGLARIRLNDGSVEILEIHGLSRYLWTTPAMDTIVTADWDTGDLLKISKSEFRIQAREDVLRSSRVAPWSLTGHDRRLFVTFHESPVLAEFDLDSLGLTKDVSMRALGHTKFNSGLYKCVYDERTDRIYVELGMVDESDRFAVLRIRASDFAVESKAFLPEGGLELALLPARESLVAASFFSQNLYELSLDPLEVRRVLRGPLNTRILSYDPERDLLYALGFLSGELQVIRLSDGARLARYLVGRKSQSLFRDAQADVLYVGGGDGLFKIDLAPFVSAWSHA